MLVIFCLFVRLYVDFGYFIFVDVGNVRLLSVGWDGGIGCGCVLWCIGGGVVSKVCEEELGLLGLFVWSRYIGMFFLDRFGYFGRSFEVGLVMERKIGVVGWDVGWCRRVNGGGEGEFLLMMLKFGGGDSWENLGVKVLMEWFSDF